ncbi:hypothetical protein QSH18_21700 [Xanthomonas sp. NCPPB 2654]|uniref:hypothetical protein n=1 Tax=unclassified Xanthomonas TaxID=2643310 RepID=UPI0021DFB8AA|nr:MULTISPECIES: hypothetical protein [unclassified Xanthomonas]MDL5368230.1 hypothetical protein [Xanthomonas sp. NCPPB 2654]UYC19356.1 hypothetical protein NUG20_14350 [Xanthomonas sp. CFBP 8443]
MNGMPCFGIGDTAVELPRSASIRPRRLEPHILRPRSAAAMRAMPHATPPHDRDIERDDPLRGNPIADGLPEAHQPLPEQRIAAVQHCNNRITAAI